MVRRCWSRPSRPAPKPNYRWGVLFPNWNGPTHQMKRHQQMVCGVHSSVCAEGPEDNLPAWSGGMKRRREDRSLGDGQVVVQLPGVRHLAGTDQHTGATTHTLKATLSWSEREVLAMTVSPTEVWNSVSFPLSLSNSPFCCQDCFSFRPLLPGTGPVSLSTCTLLLRHPPFPLSLPPFPLSLPPRTTN